jgi:mono/diheme cytochrome c family protein
VNHDPNNHHDESGASGSSETNRPLSPWLIGGFMLALLWGGLYLGMNSGGFRSDVYESNAVNWAGGGAQAAAPVDPKVVGKRLFSQNCVVCHQATGQGIAGQFPPLVGSEWVLSDAKHGENHLVMLMLHGHQGPMTVMGSGYNNAMPQWKQLTDDQIAAILTYIRSDWGNNAPAVTPEYVAKVRKECDGQSDPYTQQQLMAMPPSKEEQAAAAPAAK